MIKIREIHLRYVPVFTFSIILCSLCILSAPAHATGDKPILIGEKPLVAPKPMMRPNMREHHSIPKKGSRMKNVRKRYGKPLKKTYSIGRATKLHPKITVWHYPMYRVYFEDTQVIHTVVD